MRRTDFYIREDQHIALKAIADKETTTISFVIRRLIDEGLKPRQKVTIPNASNEEVLKVTQEYILPIIKTNKVISNPIVARAVELAKEKDIKFNPVPKPERKKK